jgi:hypothetical protein
VVKNAPVAPAGGAYVEALGARAVIRGAAVPAAHTSDRDAVLALQRTAGNRVTRAALATAAGRASRSPLSRCAGTCHCGGGCRTPRRNEALYGEAMTQLALAATRRRAGAARISRTLARAPLTSPRFAGEPLLQDCADDKARMGIGQRDSPPQLPVSKVQQALKDWGAMKGVAIDLGTTGPGSDGVDGVYGGKTAAAVKLFKATEHLGFESFGDVGPGTMNKLNALFPGAAPVTPVTPVVPVTPVTPPAVSPDDQKIADARADRQTQLRQVVNRLGAMRSLILRGALLQPGEGVVPTVEQQFPREVCVIKFWLHTSAADADYWETLGKVQALVQQDLDDTHPLISRTGADCVAHPAHAWSVIGNPGAGTQLCDQWFDSDGRHCRADVLIHETYHTLGSHHDGVDFPSERTPADAMDNADTMTQFGNDLVKASVDNCQATARAGTAATTVNACETALRASAGPPPPPSPFGGLLGLADPSSSALNAADTLDGGTLPGSELIDFDHPLATIS